MSAILGLTVFSAVIGVVFWIIVWAFSRLTLSRNPHRLRLMSSNASPHPRASSMEDWWFTRLRGNSNDGIEECNAMRGAVKIGHAVTCGEIVMPEENAKLNISVKPKPVHDDFKSRSPRRVVKVKRLDRAPRIRESKMQPNQTPPPPTNLAAASTSTGKPWERRTGITIASPRSQRPLNTDYLSILRSRQRAFSSAQAAKQSSPAAAAAAAAASSSSSLPSASASTSASAPSPSDNDTHASLSASFRDDSDEHNIVLSSTRNASDVACPVDGPPLTVAAHVPDKGEQLREHLTRMEPMWRECGDTIDRQLGWMQDTLSVARGSPPASLNGWKPRLCGERKMSQAHEEEHNHANYWQSDIKDVDRVDVLCSFIKETSS